MADTMLETIDELLELARPGGLAQRRLLKYRDQVVRNVMLGPSVTRYIKKLQAMVADDIECRHLTQLGKCRKKKLACDHVDNNKECKLYEGSKPSNQGNPLGRM